MDRSFLNMLGSHDSIAYWHKEAPCILLVLIPLACILEFAQTFKSFSFSVASVAPPPTGATFGLGALSTFPLAFCEVESLGNSFVNGMKSGAPGKYFRSGSGTLNPYEVVSCHPNRFP